MKRDISSFQNVGLSLIMFAVFPFVLVAQENNNMTFEKSLIRDANSSEITWGPCPEFMPDGCEIAVLHGDPSKQNVDILFKLPANTDIPNHWHNSPERMILLSGELEVTYKGEETQTLKQGYYAYGPAKKPHTGKCGNSGPCVLFIGFENPLDAIPVNK
ncbi:Cupin domain-containing protein [Gillisia mitskevichiae]|uniref:Cupin domain-containing protein n=1 Tax=Gillisia mitskevichiae TaxID=270921 RepID=A0A495PQX0_9FLAO|nr:cupin domain-containing protein [Gillisia mitskevichiae]RKS53034.1 Cupin domain-containing protein [Gillisia mitskevichiae]